MASEPATINKILEIDVDTERTGRSKVIIRQVSSVPVYDRERQPDPTQDIKDDLVILVNALGTCILKAEQYGTVKKGEGMKRAVELLSEMYVDASCVIANYSVDTKGNIINKPPPSL